MVDKKPYKYSGPTHNVINDLLDLLEERHAAATQPRILRGCMQTMQLLKESIQNRWKFCKLNKKISIYDILQAAVFFVLYIIFMARALVSLPCHS